MTVQEALKATGLTDEEIAALPAKALTGLTTIVTTASQDREQAELAQRAQQEIYDKQIAPALATWGINEANLTAERDYYKTLAEKAKTGGFIAEAPPFNPQTAPPAVRGADGKFVPGANPVPGSPDLVKGLRDEVGSAFAFAADTQWKYRTLYDREMPDSPTTIIREATAQRMSPSDYAAKKYDFAKREADLKAEEQKKVLDAARAEERQKVEKEFSEKFGNNPAVRQAEVSRFSSIRTGVEKGERPDPLKVSKAERHANTNRAILKDVAQNELVH